MSNVLVIGDSRIGEGFSPVFANHIGHPRGINFVRLGLAGTTPRVWHYVLRAVDPQRNRFVAVYLMAAGYRDDEVHEDYANRALDTAYLAPMLEWRDLFEYPASFTDETAFKQARLAVAFPESALHRDLVAFAGAPLTRLKKATVWHQGYPNWLRDYPGRSEAMPIAQQPFTTDAVLATLQGRARDELRVLKIVLQDEAALMDLLPLLADYARRSGAVRAAIRVQSEHTRTFRNLIEVGARVRWTDLRMSLSDYE